MAGAEYLGSSSEAIKVPSPELHLRDATDLDRVRLGRPHRSAVDFQEAGPPGPNVLKFAYPKIVVPSLNEANERTMSWAVTRRAVVRSRLSPASDRGTSAASLRVTTCSL